MQPSLLRIGIILFCLWHMAAVFAYSIPNGQRSSVGMFFEGNLKPRVRPYMQALSQWQQWNLFSPNPLRRVSVIMIDKEENGVWTPLTEVTWKELPPWRRSDELKTMRRLFDEERNAAIRVRYLSDLCRTLSIPEGTFIRMRERFYVLPYITENPSVSFWQTFVPAWEYKEDVSVICPPSA